MSKMISKSVMGCFVIFILTTSCGQLQVPTSSGPPTQVIMSTTSTRAVPTATLPPTSISHQSPQVILLDEVPSISFDEYNSILGSEGRIPSQRIAISPDGKTLAAVADMASYIRNIDGNIFLWNMDNPGMSFKAFHSSISNLGSIAFNNNGKYVAVGGCAQKDCLTSKVVIFDWLTGMVAYVLESEGTQIIQLEFTPDDENVITQDITSGIGYWNLNTGQVIHPVLNNVQFAGAHGFATSPRGDKVAVSALDGIHLLDLPTLTSSEFRARPGGEIGLGSPVAISSDGRLLVTSSCGKFDSETCISREIFIWDFNNPELKRIISLGKIFIYALEFSHNSYIFAIGTPFGITMWNASSGEKIGSPYPSQSTLVYDIVFNPNGKHFAAFTDKGILLGEIAEDRSSWRYTTLDRFGIGRKFTITKAGDNLNFRVDPTINSPVQRKLASGEIVTITYGPVTADGYVWWEVATQDYQTGWVVENADWYEPVP